MYTHVYFKMTVKGSNALEETRTCYLTFGDRSNFTQIYVYYHIYLIIIMGVI